jgi:hypothetical protein
MVKIRYTELPAGLHVSARTQGRRTVIYLLPGLTAAQRRAAFIRVRSSSRMGYGPRLPAVGTAVAIGADRVRTTVGNGVAAMRGHPVLLLPPLILLVSGAIVFVLMSFVTLTVHRPSATSARTAPAGTPAAGPSRYHVSSARSRSRNNQPGTAPGYPVAGGHHGGRPSASASPTAAGPDPATPSPSAPVPPPKPTPTVSPSPDPSPSPTSSPSPTPSPSPGACLKPAPLGPCGHL